MIVGADAILSRLDRSVKDINRYVALLDDVPERRYATASAELIGRERDKLARALAGKDDGSTRWALRSIADMSKGIIEIGSAWSSERPLEADALFQTTRQAHALELAFRPS